MSWSTSEKLNMALCGVSEGSFKFQLKNSLMLAQMILVLAQFTKRWKVISSSRLQKELSFVSVLPNIKSFLFKCNTLCDILYWKYLSSESITLIWGRL